MRIRFKRSNLNAWAWNLSLTFRSRWAAVSSTPSGRWIFDLRTATGLRTWIGEPTRPWTFRAVAKARA